MRWQIELFFKWIKQNLRIKHWIGHNENAIKIQLYTALIAFVLIRLIQEEINNKYSILSPYIYRQRYPPEVPPLQTPITI